MISTRRNLTRPVRFLPPDSGRVPVSRTGLNRAQTVMDGDCWINGFGLRSFGSQGCDLEVGFRGQARPALVTQVLKCCARANAGTAMSDADAWNLSVSRRTECLIAIATSGGRTDVVLPATCSAAECGQPMEVTVSLTELVELQRNAERTDPLVVQNGGASLQLRRPTGRDQAAWLDDQHADETEAFRAMIRSLLVPEAGHETSVSDELVTAADRLLAEGDPLVNFNLAVKCPHCGSQANYSFDLEALALQELQQSQTRLLRTVHRLASHYHWSEQQVLSVSPWRRDYYLAQIEREAP